MTFTLAELSSSLLSHVEITVMLFWTLSREGLGVLRTPCHGGVDSGVLQQLNLELGGFIGLLLLPQGGWRNGTSHAGR
jgi:hypothetical protein